MGVDTEELLTEVGITYTTTGKNIGQGWIGVECIQCGDTSNHAAISPNGKVLHCWSCGYKCGIIKFIQRTLNIPYNKAKALVKKHSSVFNSSDVIFQDVPDIILPGTPELSSLTKTYLKKRGFDPEYLSQTYSLYDGGRSGPYKYRVIVPIFMNYELVTFAARDVSGQQELRYKNLSSMKSKLPIGEVLYGIDDIDKSAIVVEGIFDSLVFPQGVAVASLGTVMTPAQLNKLSKLDAVYLLLDADKAGQRKAKEIHNILDMCGVQVEILDLPEGVNDPGELNKTQVQQIVSMYIGG